MLFNNILYIQLSYFVLPPKQFQTLYQASVRRIIIRHGNVKTTFFIFPMLICLTKIFNFVHKQKRGYFSCMKYPRFEV